MSSRRGWLTRISKPQSCVPEVKSLPSRSQTVAEKLGDRFSWMADGTCVDRQDVDWFAVDEPGISQAKALCTQCPVVHHCLDQALARHEYGVWGGTTERERQALRGPRASD